MKKLLRLTVAALMLATAQVSTAQIKMAPTISKQTLPFTNIAWHKL